MRIKPAPDNLLERVAIGMNLVPPRLEAEVPETDADGSGLPKIPREGLDGR